MIKAHPFVKTTGTWLLLALVLGEKHQVSTTTRAVIRNVEADHLFAVSALHIIGLSLCVGWLVLRFSFLLNLSAALWLAVLSSLSWAVIMLCSAIFQSVVCVPLACFFCTACLTIWTSLRCTRAALFCAVAVLWFQRTAGKPWCSFVISVSLRNPRKRTEPVFGVAVVHILLELSGDRQHARSSSVTLHGSPH